MSAQRAGEENIRTLEAGVGRGWGRVLNLLKAGEELGLLEREAVVSWSWTIK